MTAPSETAKRRVAMFDSYCKTAIRNASRNLKRAAINRQKYMLPDSEPIQYLFDLIHRVDTYPSDQSVLRAGAFACVVHSETLSQALGALPEIQRLVLILDFWEGWPDGEIARYLSVTPRTVYNLRRRAFLSIRTFYEEGRTNP